MSTFVLLLRGINVGGHNLIPMKDLVPLLEDMGYKNVKTYIQSGNVVLNGKTKPGSAVASQIEKRFGFKPEVLILSEYEFKTAVENNPFIGQDGKFVHFYFCAAEPELDNDRLQTIVSNTESYQLVGRIFYLHASDGIGRSKLVANIESVLGVQATGRNLNTVNKLYRMLDNG